MYQLIKDFESHQIVFYWLNDQSEQISPTLPSAEHAKEWLLDHHFCTYEGPERRSSKIDRRRLEKNDNFNARSAFSNGRRITDRSIKVDRDLAKQKIEELLSDRNTETK